MSLNGSMQLQTQNNILAVCLLWLFWQLADMQSARFHWHFKITFEFLYVYLKCKQACILIFLFSKITVSWLKEDYFFHKFLAPVNISYYHNAK